MKTSYTSPFHSDEAVEVSDEIIKLDWKFKHYVAISKFQSQLEEVAKQYLEPFGILSMIQVKIGSKENATEATELTYGSKDAEYINSYQHKWLRDEDILSFFGLKLGPKSLLEDKAYTNQEIDNAIQHHLKIILPNQPEAQKKYFDLLKKSYVVDEPLSPAEMNDLHVLWNVIHKSMEYAFEAWISEILKQIAEFIRKAKIVDDKYWRYKNEDGSINKDFEAFLPITGIQEFAVSTKKSLEKKRTIITNYLENLEAITEEVGFFIHTTIVTFRKLFEGINKFIHFFLSLLEAFADVLAHVNAFCIGLYNGIIEFIAGLFDLLAFFTGLMKKENRTAFEESVDEFYKKYEEIGVFGLVKEIFNVFIQKYKDAPNSYDIAKYLGEDIMQIVIEILITAASGGSAAVKRLSKILKDIRNGVFRQQLIGAAKIIDDVLKGRVKLNEYIDEFGNVRKRKKGDYTRYANFAEMVANEAILAIKYYRGKPARFRLVIEVPKSLDDKIKKGIDAIYENELFDAPGPPPKYIISEVKGNTTSNPLYNAVNKLRNKNGYKQMSSEWIERNLIKLDDFLQEDILLNGYDPIVTGVNMDGTIKSMDLLNDQAKRIQNLL